MKKRGNRFNSIDIFILTIILATHISNNLLFHVIFIFFILIYFKFYIFNTTNNKRDNKDLDKEYISQYFNLILRHHVK